MRNGTFVVKQNVRVWCATNLEKIKHPLSFNIVLDVWCLMRLRVYRDLLDRLPLQYSWTQIKPLSTVMPCTCDTSAVDSNGYSALVIRLRHATVVDSFISSTVHLQQSISLRKSPFAIFYVFLECHVNNAVLWTSRPSTHLFFNLFAVANLFSRPTSLFSSVL